MGGKLVKYLLAYQLFFLPSLLIVTLMWTTLVNGKLYYCSDKVPFLDFIPPFVHGANMGDYYIVDPRIVWIIWFLLVGLVFLIPLVLTKKLIQETHNPK